MRLLIIILLISSVAQGQQISSAYPNAAWGAGHYLGIARYIHPSHTPGTKDPVIIWMHGNGGATDYTTTSTAAAITAADRLRGIGASEGGLPNELEDGVDISSRKANNGANPLERFVVISPAQDLSHDGFASGINQNYVDYVWQYMRDSLLDYVDTNRVYIVGWSGGGNGVWKYPTRTLADANKIAAIVPIAAVPVTIIGSWCHIANSGLPVWAFHGGDDVTVDDVATNNAVSQINSTCGATTPAVYWHPAGDDHFEILTSALGPSNRKSDASGVSAPTTSMNIYEWMLQYDRVDGGGGSGLCGNAYRLPIPEYRVYDFSSYSAYYKNVRSNAAGSGSAQFLFRDDYDPKNGVTPTSDDLINYFGMPRNNNNLNIIYSEGFLKIWVDFRRKVYIDTMVILHNTYTTDSFYVILDHDSTFWNDKGVIRGIPNIKPITPVLSVRPPSNNGNPLTTTYRINDSARFMLLLIKNNKVTHSADSMFRPQRIALYGCTDEPIAFNDSTWTGPRKAKLPIGNSSGSNYTIEELAFGPGQTREHLWPERYYRRYQLRGPSYAFDNDSTQQFQVDYRVNSYNFSWDDYVSEETFFEGITGWDSVSFSRWQPYIFHSEQGASAYVAKQVRDAGISLTQSYDWIAIDSIGKDYKQPSSYARAGDMAYHKAAIHGAVAVDTNFLRLRYRGGKFARTGLGIHKGYQPGNEDNLYTHVRPMSPIEYDAQCQSIYDGDEGDIGPRIGVKAADPNMQLLSTGLAQYDLQFGRSIMYLSQMNRTDRKMIYDVMCYHAYWVTWDDIPTAANFNFAKKAYPESDTALHILNTLADETYIQAGDTLHATAYTEYGTDHTYRRPVDQTESFSISLYSAPKYRNAAGVILDSLESQAIDVMRDEFTMDMSGMLWGAQYLHRDLVASNAGNRFAAYQFSGKINPFDGIKWKLWYLRAGIKRRFGNYVPDTVLNYEDKGVVQYRLRHISNPDSVMYVVYHADTLGTESFALDVGNVTSSKEWHESYTSEWGTESNVTVTGGNINGTASPEFTFYVVHEDDTENQSPTSAAGTDQSITLPTSQVTVDGGSSSDPDGTVDTYLWSKISGPATFTITDPNSSSTTITGLVEGTYVFRLTVTDNDGAEDTDDITITVNPAPNMAPNAAAGSDQVITLPTTQVTVNGSSSSDPDGTISTYLWTKISGPSPFTITNPNNASTTITGLIVGTYVFRLTVTDDDSATDTDDITIVVNALPAPSNRRGWFRGTLRNIFRN